MPESDGTPSVLQSTDKFLIDQILPARDLALVYGPTHSGKGRLVQQWVDDWSNGRDVLGCQSHPARFCYVSCERTRRLLESDLRAIGIDPAEFPHVSMEGAERHVLSEAYAIAERAMRGATPRLLILDGIMTLCEGNITYHRDSSKFVKSILQLCENHEITIIGIATSSKDSGQYARALDLLPGSVAWASGTGTKAYLGFVRGNSERRVLKLWTRHGPERTWTYECSPTTGRFYEVADGINMGEMDTWLLGLDTGFEFERLHAIGVGEQLQVPQRTVERWLADQCTQGTLTRVRRGQYRVPERPPIA